MEAVDQNVEDASLCLLSGSGWHGGGEGTAGTSSQKSGWSNVEPFR